MKKPASRNVTLWVIGSVIGLLIMVGGKQVIGQSNGNGNPPALRQHLHQLNVTDIGPRCDGCFLSQFWTVSSLPKADTPVFLVGSSSNVVIDGAVQPSITFAGTFILDSSTGKVTGSWYGKSDSPKYGLEFIGPENTSEVAGPSIRINANACNAGNCMAVTSFGMLRITMWY